MLLLLLLLLLLSLLLPLLLLMEAQDSGRPARPSKATNIQARRRGGGRVFLVARSKILGAGCRGFIITLFVAAEVAEQVSHGIFWQEELMR